MGGWGLMNKLLREFKEPLLDWDSYEAQHSFYYGDGVDSSQLTRMMYTFIILHRHKPCALACAACVVPQKL